jgi:hypothetical protein
LLATPSADRPKGLSRTRWDLLRLNRQRRRAAKELQAVSLQDPFRRSFLNRRQQAESLKALRTEANPSQRLRQPLLRPIVFREVW